MLTAIEQGRRVESREFRFRRRDGSEILCLVSAGAITIGGVRCLVATFVDVTDRRQAEEISARDLRLVLRFHRTSVRRWHLAESESDRTDFIGAAWPEVAGRLFWDTPWWSHSPEMRELCRQRFAGPPAESWFGSRLPTPHATAISIRRLHDHPVKDPRAGPAADP